MCLRRDWLFPSWGPAMGALTSDRRWHASPTGQRSPLHPAKDRRGDREDPLRPSLGHAEIS